MLYLVENRRRAGLLTGPSGCGRTTLLQRFAARAPVTSMSVVLIPLAGLSQEQLLGRCLDALGGDASAGEPIERLWNHLGDKLIENRYRGVATALLCDPLDSASAASQLGLLRLIQLADVEAFDLTLILSVEDRAVGRLDRQLLSRCDLRIDLEPWDFDETAAFLKILQQHRGVVFDAAAVEILYQLSGGNPRHLEQLTELTLLAAGGGEQPIDAETIQGVYEELTVR